eukprot:TRINITY_DN544_c0_g1_i1.p1 TRINITY_DN544_c0_g1~~TRINITY_DN544_c0_g1_i1.p1  ORF type:complete len:265 (+),score=97.82 TRINITY_DN544_c0_g1_i1:54-797(+)
MAIKNKIFKRKKIETTKFYLPPTTSINPQFYLIQIPTEVKDFLKNETKTKEIGEISDDGQNLTLKFNDSDFNFTLKETPAAEATLLASILKQNEIKISQQNETKVPNSIQATGPITKRFTCIRKFDNKHIQLAKQSKNYIKQDSGKKMELSDEVKETEQKRQRIIEPIADKRERLPQDQVRAKILQAFKLKSSYSFKELIELTKQPDNYLKEILRELCKLVKEGSNKNRYELSKDLSKVSQQVSSDK